MMVDVNNKEIREYSKQLRKMHRSNFPIVARQTLNDLAFDVKKNTFLQSADKEFILRNPSFFKKHSGVKKAIGFDINSMKSEVGIDPNGNKAATNLEKQEIGGSIKKPAIYMDTARVSKSKLKRVRRANYLNKKIVRGTPNVRRSKNSQLIADAVIAKKINKYVLYDNTIFDVKDINFGKGKKRKAFVKMLPIASYKQNRSVTLKARPFLYPASLASHKKADFFFIRNAKKRLK